MNTTKISAPARTRFPRAYQLEVALGCRVRRFWILQWGGLLPMVFLPTRAAGAVLNWLARFVVIETRVGNTVTTERLFDVGFFAPDREEDA